MNAQKYYIAIIGEVFGDQFFIEAAIPEIDDKKDIAGSSFSDDRLHLWKEPNSEGSRQDFGDDQLAERFKINPRTTYFSDVYTLTEIERFIYYCRFSGDNVTA